eukprot:UN17426
MTSTGNEAPQNQSLKLSSQGQAGADTTQTPTKLQSASSNEFNDVYQDIGLNIETKNKSRKASKELIL